VKQSHPLPYLHSFPTRRSSDLIIRQTQHLAAVKVVGDALVLEIMRFANELVDANEFNFPSREGVRPQELQMAEQLVENLAEPFRSEEHTSELQSPCNLVCRLLL